MSLLLRPSQSELLSVGFNQDQSCFAVGAVDGFRIYNSDPFKETFRRNFSSGGIGMVEMLFRCNILALVGGGVSPRWPKHKVMVWDDHQNRCIGELSFRSEVKAVRLRRDRVVVALMNRVYVYNFADLVLVDHLETADNPRGLCVVCPAPTNNVLACPGPVKGQVRVEMYDSSSARHQRRLIDAHDTPLACIALNAQGTRLATASEKGTLIRVWDTVSGELLQELRRGADPANICCIAFSAATTLLACASDKGTVHIFKLSQHVADSGGEGAAAAAAATAATAAAAIAASSTASAASSGAAGAAAATPAAAAAAAAAATGSTAASQGAAGGAEKHSSSSSSSSSHSSQGSSASSSSGTSAGGAKAGGGGGGDGSGTGRGEEGGGWGSGSAAAGGSGTMSLFRGVQKLLPKYFSSEWSFAQFRVPPLLSICAFGAEPNTILVVCADGSFLKANFEKGGDAVRIAYAHFSKGDSKTEE